MRVFVDVCFDCFCCVYLGDRLFDCILVAGFAVMIICGGFGLIVLWCWPVVLLLGFAEYWFRFLWVYVCCCLFVWVYKFVLFGFGGLFVGWVVCLLFVLLNCLYFTRWTCCLPGFWWFGLSDFGWCGCGVLVFSCL